MQFGSFLMKPEPCDGLVICWTLKISQQNHHCWAHNWLYIPALKSQACTGTIRRWKVGDIKVFCICGFDPYTSSKRPDEEQLDQSCSTKEEANEVFTLLWETGSRLSCWMHECMHVGVFSSTALLMRTDLSLVMLRGCTLVCFHGGTMIKSSNLKMMSC